ncbi:MAG: hypothetical protein K2M79_01695 [Muribaculaceae bacterium]|nr:hypothetical protein [Muribaculaceae bacterium]
MQDILIYGGIGINIIGALVLMAYALKYTYAFHANRDKPVQTTSLKHTWAKKRIIGIGLMILGTIILLLGTSI